MLFQKPNAGYTKGAWSSVAFFNTVLLLLKGRLLMNSTVLLSSSVGNSHFFQKVLCWLFWVIVLYHLHIASWNPDPMKLVRILWILESLTFHTILMYWPRNDHTVESITELSDCWKVLVCMHTMSISLSICFFGRLCIRNLTACKTVNNISIF